MANPTIPASRMVYGFDHDGGFCVAVSGTNLTAYAYPTSDFARQAARNPGDVAQRMLSPEHLDFLRTFVVTCGYERMVTCADVIWGRLTGDTQFRGGVQQFTLRHRLGVA